MTFNYARDHTSGFLAAGTDDWAVGVRKALQDKTVSRCALNVRHRQARIYRWYRLPDTQTSFCSAASADTSLRQDCWLGNIRSINMKRSDLVLD